MSKKKKSNNSLNLFFMLSALVVAFTLAGATLLIFNERISKVESKIGNVTSNTATIAFIKSDPRGRVGNVWLNGNLLGLCKDDQETPCIYNSEAGEYFHSLSIGNLKAAYNYTVEWDDRLVSGFSKQPKDTVVKAFTTLNTTSNGPYIFRGYGRLLDNSNEGLSGAVITVKSRTFGSLLTEKSEASYPDLVAVTGAEGQYAFSLAVSSEENSIQNFEVYYQGRKVKEFKGSSFMSKPYSDIVIDEVSSDENHYGFLGILSKLDIINEAYADHSTDPKEIQEEQRDRILCKPGENLGIKYRTPPSLLAEAKSNNFSWIESLITDLGEMPLYKETVVNAFDYGITPVLRICYQNSDCPSSGAAYGQAFLNVYAQLGAEGSLPSNGLYVHAGHNEPNVSEYRDPNVEAQFVADFINVLKSADVISQIQNDVGIKIISPQMDLYHRNNGPGGVGDVGLGHPVYEADAYVSAMKSHAAFNAVSGEVYAWSVNDYWFDRGPVVPADIRAFQGHLGSLGLSQKIFVTEIGRMNKSVGWGEFSGMLNEVMSIEGVESVMLFDSLGANPDPVFNYHQDLWDDNPNPGSLFNGCGGDGYLIFQQEYDVETGEGSPVPGGGQTTTNGNGTTGGPGTTEGTSTAGTTGATTTADGTTTSGNTGDTTTGSSSTGNDDGSGDSGETPSGNVPACYEDRNADHLLYGAVGVYRIRGNKPLTPKNSGNNDDLDGNLRPVDKFVQTREYELTSDNFIFTRNHVLANADREIIVYEDKNGNCVQDAGEQFIDPNGPDDQIDTGNEGNILMVRIDEGVDMLSFPYELRELSQASDLVDKINQYGGYATSVGKYTYQSGWAFYTQRDSVTFSPDFNLDSAQPLYVVVHSPAVVPIRISELRDAPEVTLKNGWNFVPIYGVESLDAEITIDSLPVSDALPEAQIVSKWRNEASIYQSLARSGDQYFGENFSIDSGSALFVYSNRLPQEGISWIPGQ